MFPEKLTLIKDENFHLKLKSGTTTTLFKVSHAPHYTIEPNVSAGL